MTVIGLLALLPAVGTDLYLPSLPDVARELGATEAGAQFTITGVMLGGAVGQLIAGPFSDRFGRRLPAVIGVASHAVLSLLCALAPGIAVLSGLRVLQGFAAAGATVVAIAAIRDRYVGAEAARLMSRLMLVIAAAPLLAPSIGGAIAAAWGWRAVFVALAAVGGGILLSTPPPPPGTMPAHPRRRQRPRELAAGYLSLLADRRFVALAALPGAMMAVIFGYVAASPFVLQEQYGLGTQQFAGVFALGGLFLVGGSQLNAAVVRRAGLARLLRVATPVSALLGVLLVVVVLADLGGLAGLLATLWAVLAAIGFVGANASALALTRHGERAGTAAATIGFLQASIAGLVSPLVGVLGGDGLAMALVIAGSMIAAVVVLAVGTPVYRREGWLALGSTDQDGSVEAAVAPRQESAGV